MADSAPLIGPTKRPDTMMSLMLDVLGRLQYKHAVFLFVLYILLCIDTFDENITSRFSGAFVDGSITGYGVIIKGILLVLCYLFIDMLTKLGFL